MERKHEKWDKDYKKYRNLAEWLNSNHCRKLFKDIRKFRQGDTKKSPEKIEQEIRDQMREITKYKRSYP